MSGPAIIGAKGSHDALRRELAARPPGKVLDIPAGRGPISHFLRDRGWEVHASDIDAGNFELEGFPFTPANLNRPLPFADESFDAIVSANAVHRLFNPGCAIREFFRILRPGGALYLNVNNYASIKRRLRFLLYGSIDNAVNSAQCAQTTDDPEANVRIAIVYAQIAGMLDAAGFVTEKVAPADVRASHTLLAPLALLLRVLALGAGPKSRRRSRIGETNQWALFPGGNYMLIVARKPGGAGAPGG